MPRPARFKACHAGDIAAGSAEAGNKTILHRIAAITIPRLIEESGELPCLLRIGGFGWGMIRDGFFSAEDRRHLIALARDGSAALRLTRRANALVLRTTGGAVKKSRQRFC
jgi:hypothetical protein